MDNPKKSKAEIIASYFHSLVEGINTFSRFD